MNELTIVIINCIATGILIGIVATDFKARTQALAALLDGRVKEMQERELIAKTHNQLVEQQANLDKSLKDQGIKLHALEQKLGPGGILPKNFMTGR